eukprot:scaffold54379_cov33-Tisochrysis_lutea.AAC.1
MQGERGGGTPTRDQRERGGPGPTHRAHPHSKRKKEPDPEVSSSPRRRQSFSLESFSNEAEDTAAFLPSSPRPHRSRLDFCT